MLGVVGRQSEPVAGEEVFQRPGQRAAPGNGSLEQGLRVDGAAVSQEPPVSVIIWQAAGALWRGTR